MVIKTRSSRRPAMKKAYVALIRLPHRPHQFDILQNGHLHVIRRRGQKPVITCTCGPHRVEKLYVEPDPAYVNVSFSRAHWDNPSSEEKHKERSFSPSLSSVSSSSSSLLPPMDPLPSSSSSGMSSPSPNPSPYLDIRRDTSLMYMEVSIEESKLNTPTLDSMFSRLHSGNAEDFTVERLFTPSQFESISRLYTRTEYGEGYFNTSSHTLTRTEFFQQIKELATHQITASKLREQYELPNQGNYARELLRWSSIEVGEHASIRSMPSTVMVYQKFEPDKDSDFLLYKKMIWNMRGVLIKEEEWVEDNREESKTGWNMVEERFFNLKSESIMNIFYNSNGEPRVVYPQRSSLSFSSSVYEEAVCLSRLKELGIEPPSRSSVSISSTLVESEKESSNKPN